MISVQHLTKRYGGQLAVDDVSFDCPPGTVTGFLGPNGAGKSTTLRMVCGLGRPTSGTATIDGAPYAAMTNPARRVGVLLDASAMHPGRTGQETLAVSAAVMGVAGSRVPEVLELVGLTGRAPRRRVRAYSLGMRQRLGVAHALLGNPGVLVLDEPANGLDPEGIRWMRTMLRGFADAGGTVLLSSHLLREVEAVADRLVVIGGGRVVAYGDKASLLSTTQVLARPLEGGDQLRAALERAGHSVTVTRDGALLVEAAAEQVARTAVTVGVLLVELRPDDDGGLERLVMSLTSTEPEVAR